MIRNIIFDMGNVLMYFVPKVFVQRTGRSEEEQNLLLEQIFRSPDWVHLDDGSMNEQQLYEKVCTALPEYLHEDAWKMLHWDEPGILLVEGTEELVRELKEKGYGLYLLSNASMHQKVYWPTMPVSALFDGTLISAEVKMIKPQEGIYRELFRRFDLVPEECFFIDDSPANIAGGRALGMDGYVFDGNVEALREYLGKLPEL